MDDTGINADDVLAQGCEPLHGPGAYNVPGPNSEVTIAVHHVG